jgi:hypothetical protein
MGILRGIHIRKLGICLRRLNRLASPAEQAGRPGRERTSRNGAGGGDGTRGGWACQGELERQRAVSWRVGADAGLGRARSQDRVTDRKVIEDDPRGRPAIVETGLS